MSARVRRRRALVAVLCLAVLAGLTWRAARGAGSGEETAVAMTPRPPAAGPSPLATGPAPARLATVAGLGPRTLASVPAVSTQVVVVRGDGPTSATATIELYQRSSGRWVRSGQWRGHVGARGWTSNHREGDLRTPVGTYSLRDAGGRAPDPGTALPYYRSPQFEARGESVYGESLEGSFDYVIAIDYNRRAGRSPLDEARPRGAVRGGGIWLHVDHGDPTHGCVSVPVEGMKTLLRALGPTRHPVVVMGGAAALRT